MTALQGATVTITGGTGSFGSTMVSHLLTRGVDTINILSRDEAKQDEMRRRFSNSRLRINLRAAQTPTQRTRAKLTALEAYVEWRRGIGQPLATEKVLDSLEPMHQSAVRSLKPTHELDRRIPSVMDGGEDV